MPTSQITRHYELYRINRFIIVELPKTCTVIKVYKVKVLSKHT